MDRVPCVVIGAGAIGLATAKALSESGIYTLVLERHPSFGVENSSRNSEVLHAGLYYPPESLKARLCLKGRLDLMRYIKNRNIAYNNCGKLVIATSPDEENTLQGIYSNCLKNGLKEPRLLNRADVIAMEPNVYCSHAMLSPNTSIVDSHEIMLNFVADIEGAGSSIVYNCSVEKINTRKSGGRNDSCVDGNNTAAPYAVVTDQGVILCDYLVNAAGLSAQLVSSKIDGLHPRFIPPAYFAKGNYYKLEGVTGKNAPFQRLIYPIPKAGGLGVHATIDLEGNVRFGPDVEWVLPRCLPYGSIDTSCANKRGHHSSISEITVPKQDKNAEDVQSTGSSMHSRPSHFDFAVNTTIAQSFKAEIVRYWPAVQQAKLVPDYAGIRPKLAGPANQTPFIPYHKNTAMVDCSDPGTNQPDGGDNSGHESDEQATRTYRMKSSPDFFVSGRRNHGLPGLVCLYGIESPGLTSSLALGSLVRDILMHDK